MVYRSNRKEKLANYNADLKKLSRMHNRDRKQERKVNRCRKQRESKSNICLLEFQKEKRQNWAEANLKTYQKVIKTPKKRRSLFTWWKTF